MDESDEVFRGFVANLLAFSARLQKFGAPNTHVGNKSFGIISGAGRPRNTQFGLKFIF